MSIHPVAQDGLYMGLSIKNFWATPQDVFDALDHEFRFDLDAAAEAKTAKCKEWLGLDHLDPERRDALHIREWPKKLRRVFLNPPYSPDGGGLKRWVGRALLEVDRWDGFNAVCVMLLPGTADTEWAIRLYKAGAELRFTPRIAFLDPCGGGRSAPTGGSLIAVLRPGMVERPSRDAALITLGYAPWKAMS